MRKTHEKKENNKILITTVFVIVIIVLVTNSTRILKKPTDVCVVANGSLYYEESAEGYIIRDEVVLQGENFKNGMVRTLGDGERAAKGQVVFRYYSNNEENINKQINEIDEEINEIVENSGTTVISSDISSLDTQIEETIEAMRDINYLQEINENKNKIEAYISKKTQITGLLSPEDSYLRSLTERRNNLEKDLENGSEKITTPIPGLASYRIDGLEEKLTTNNFDYLTTELLESFELKVGASTPLSNEKGKIVNNFECYIAVPISTEKAQSAQVGETVSLRLSNSKEINAEIVYIKDEEKNRIIVFKIDESVSELLEYRKISIDIIWWKYTGLKISNSCILEDEKDMSYVEMERAGYVEKILIKVLRQNDTHSIVRNYEDEELKELGYKEDEIEKMVNIKLYDEIISY